MQKNIPPQQNAAFVRGENPCPRCGHSRLGLEVQCAGCGWNPQAASNQKPVLADRPRDPPPSVIFAGLLGLATLVPIAYVVVFLLIFVGAVLEPESMNHERFQLLFVGQLFIVGLSLGLFVYYIYYLATSNRLSIEERVIWIVLMVTGFVFAAPIFWFLYFWNPAGQIESV